MLHVVVAAKYLSRSEDVHMGYDPVTKKGGDMTCVACHQVKKDASGNMIDHGIGGFMYHSVDEGVMKDCTDCHGSAASIHAGSSVERVLASQAHDRLACQVCHIPAFARKVATYVDWKWSLAGQDARPADCAASPTGVAADGVTQRGTYAKMKGCFTWGTNVRPELRFYDGKWNRMIVGFNNTYTTTPVDLGSPSATYRDPAAKIYPFKTMTGNQVADTARKIMVIPHLYGTAAGPNAYWSKYDWLGSLADASAYLPAYNAGEQAVVAEYGFVDTVMLLKVDHEIAPSEQALGMGGDCADCHFSGQIYWPALGWTKDPTEGGTQTLP